MFEKSFFPTPFNVIEEMTAGEIIKDKVILEPSAGKGDIVKYLLNAGAKTVIACESNAELRQILQNRCNVVSNDFFELKSHEISHIDMIVMNPPFDNADKHILHAHEIAPAGCRIIALCNSATLKNDYSKTRTQLKTIIETYGSVQELGSCFYEAERKTEVETSLIKIQKAGASYSTEFEGFFTEEEQEAQENGIMSYNVIRDLVNRYVGAIKIFDEQMETAVKLNTLLTGFFEHKQPHLSISVNRLTVPLKRSEFKKEMQKAGWNFIFEKMNMRKYSTKSLKEDLNKFVEQQQHIPFTMRNIYNMIDIVIGTQRSRMDKALEEVFDTLTKHTHENRFNVEGWQTNSHYLVNTRFIIPCMCGQSKYSSGNKIEASYGHHMESIEDLLKALCYITGDNYDTFETLSESTKSYWKIRNKLTGEYIKDDTNGKPETFREHSYASSAILYKHKQQSENLEIVRPDEKVYGEWFEWAYFKVKAFKKGTMHFEFKDIDLWAKFNQNISRIKGFPLFEEKQNTAWQDRQQKKYKAA